MPATLKTSWNMKMSWKRCWRSIQRGQLLFMWIWRMLTGLQRRYVTSNFKGNYIHFTMLQKGVSGDSEDDSNDEGHSDVSLLFHVDDFELYFSTELERTYESWFWIGASPWTAREEILQWPWFWLHIHWRYQLGVNTADSIYDEGMGSRFGK